MSIDRVSVRPELVWLYSSRFDIGEAIMIGPTPLGLRRVVPIEGGAVEGERISGTVLPGGADRQLVRSDGVVEVSARYMVRTPDDAIISVHNEGILRAPADVLAELVANGSPAPSRYYFRTRPSFETSHPSYTWLNQSICVAVAEVRGATILVTVYEVT